MKKLSQLFLAVSGQRAGRRFDRKLFNSARLEQQRNDVFVMMHQQMSGLR